MYRNRNVEGKNMRHVMGDGRCSATSRSEGRDRVRIVALVASFFLFTAGLVVVAPGLMSASAGSGSHSGDGGNGDGRDDGHHDSSCKKDDGRHAGDDAQDGDGQQDDETLDVQTDGDASSFDSADSASITSDEAEVATTDGYDDGADLGGDDGHYHDRHDRRKCPTTAMLTLNKVVVNDNGGSATVADFTLTATSSLGGVAAISGPDPAADSPVGITAHVPVAESYVLSETGPAGYDSSTWQCSAGTLDGATLTLEPGDVANCTITNDDTPPPANPASITVAKLLGTPQWGGQLVAADFQLQIDGSDVSQLVAHEVLPGVHTISELPRPGYQQTAIVCTDLTTSTQLSNDGSVTLAAGQHVECDVTNAEVPPTLTLMKFVTNDNGGNAVSPDFQLQIDGVNAAQNTPIPVVAGAPHAITELPTAGYRLVSLTCADDTNQPVAYNAGVTLALGQHVTCRLTNDDDPVDLVITKTDDGVTKIAGGPPFAYTITVDNLGPRDASTTEPVTVTDQLPAGFDFVTFPANCTAAGQVLTCDIAPADLQVADPPVVLTVTVKVHPDAASGIYTNLAYVATADDPACVGIGCIPVCGSGSSNNVACATTTIKRQANITINKVDNVDGPILPGTNYAYLITVGNSGPSTFLASMTMTDDLPAGLIFQSVSAAAPWTCNNSDPIACTYGAVLQPNTTAPVVTVNVQLDPTFTGASIHNVANAFAVVEPPTAQTQALQIEAPADPGTVVTATDDETTTVLRNVNLSIDKSVSQATAAGGDQFNWILDITNHGPDTASNVVVSDTIPAAFDVIGTFPTAGLSCTSSGNSVQCTAASMVNGATLRAVVQVRVAAAATPGAVTNTATVVTDSNETDATDNSDSASITVTGVGSEAPVPPASASASSGITLPRTGNSSLDGSLSMAGLLFLGGVFSLAIARRRRAAAM
jgi:uncharacterized repeat protein (TIGR01451 family)/LPXTG-motif cell wall-anchored protein